jgi:hypothetical protein
MREVFEIRNDVHTANTLGAGGTVTPTAIYTNVRGRLNDLSSTEKERNKRLEMDTTHELQIWARGYTLKPGYIFYMASEGRSFKLISIGKYENRDEVFNLKVKESGVKERA